MEDIVKEYSKDDVTIVWQPKKCIHSKKCWIELGEVFNPNLKPWIDVTKADTQRIIEQVQKCPSGALSIKNIKVDLPSVDSNSSSNNTEIVVLKNGPLKIKGSLSLKHKDGKEEMQKEVYLCRCGQSDNKPFCDGAHKKCGFKDE
jgi:uncharacterized Fe-S cluster protein YjdI